MGLDDDASAAARPRTLLAVALLAGAVALGAAYLELAYDIIGLEAEYLAADRAAASMMAALRPAALTPLVVAATELGSWAGVVIIVAVAAGLLWWRGHLGRALALVGATATGALVLGAAKQVIGRVRPPQELAAIPLPTSYSFPSGHAMMSLIVFGGIGLVVLSLLGLRRGWLPALGLLVFGLAVGVTRVYLGVHWSSDVTAGWLLGGSWLLLWAAGWVVVSDRLRIRRAAASA
jgi:undecaprenyl-diphosphatase